MRTLEPKVNLTDLFAVGFGLGFLRKNIANDEEKCKQK